MAAQRRAPAGGYDFEEKHKYRHGVWQELRKRCPVPVGLAQAMLMPSLEGAEIDVAKAYGFREENLHVVDMNPAIVATLKRRYPGIVTYGVKLERAMERAASGGHTIHVANFDFTSCVGRGLHEAMRAVGEAGALHGSAAWAATVLRGREGFGPAGAADRLAELIPPDLCAVLSRAYGADLAPTDAIRLGCLVSGMHSGDAPLHRPARVGIYRSGRQTMLWAVFARMEDIKRRKVSRKKRARLANRLELVSTLYFAGLAFSQSAYGTQPRGGTER